MYDEIIEKINAGSLSEARTKLVQGIKHGQINTTQLDDVIERLKKTDGGTHYLFETSFFKCTDNVRLWNEAYIEKITIAILSGDVSPALLYHMLDVCKYVRKKKIMAVGAGCALIGVIVAVAIYLAQ